MQPKREYNEFSVQINHSESTSFNVATSWVPLDDTSGTFVWEWVNERRPTT